MDGDEVRRRIQTGIDPVGDDGLETVDDLRRALRRIGHDDISLTVWDFCEWESPRCDGGLELVDYSAEPPLKR